MSDISVRFWGVRGSIPCPDAGLARYGGNTACVEVRCGQHLVIFDGGTGLRLLGDKLVRQPGSIAADLFYSHAHTDHISGLPFFAPCFFSSNVLRLWAGNLLPQYTLEKTLREFMSEPVFPNAFDTFAAQIQFRDFNAGEVLYPRPGMTVRTAALNHPGGATGYRLEYDGRSIAYITDTEHKLGQPDKNVLALVQGADLMIYDGSYTDKEFPERIGWGHSTWQEGARLADAADVGKLAIFHHDPMHDDVFLDRVAAEVSARRPGSIVASEGASVLV